MVSGTEALQVSPQQLRDGLRRVGVARGEVVYVASSLAALGLMDDPVGAALSALEDAVGCEGTLVFPAFNFGFCRGAAFDRENTPAETGILAEAARRRPNARRTWSPPFHTVAAMGRRAEEVAAIAAPTSFGAGSVFQWLCDVNARHVLLGCGFHAGVAHFHWLEERFAVPYRFWKKFCGPVTVDGATRSGEFFMYARRDGVVLDADPLGRQFELAGHVQSTDVGLCRIRVFLLADFARFFAKRFAADPLLLLPAEQRERYRPRCGPVLAVDHVAIASRYAPRIREVLEECACRPEFVAPVAELGVNVEIFAGLNVKIEVVEAAREDSCVSRHVERNPTCPLHHLAFRVADLGAAVEHFRARGYAPLDGRVLSGAEPGQQVLFLSPVQTGGLLIELVAGGRDADGRGGL